MLDVGSHFFPYIPIKALANAPQEDKDVDAWECAGGLGKEVQTKETSKEHRQLFPSSLNHPKTQSKMDKSLSFEHEPFDQTSEVSLYTGDKVRTSNSSTVSVDLGVTHSKHPTPFPLYFRASFVKSESLLMFWFVFSFTSGLHSVLPLCLFGSLYLLHYFPPTPTSVPQLLIAQPQ